MSLDAHLIHTCTIQRVTKSTDPYNNATREAWEDIARGMPCRLVIKSQTVYSQELQQFLVVTRYLGLLPAETDVREEDRLTDVVLETGALEAGPYRVLSLLPRVGRFRHHLSLSLEKAA